MQYRRSPINFWAPRYSGNLNSRKMRRYATMYYSYSGRTPLVRSEPSAARISKAEQTLTNLLARE